MTTQIKSHIPKEISEAATAMLKPYAPGLTPDKLASAITPKDDQQKEMLLTRKEAAEALHVSLPTIDRMLHSGELTRTRVRSRTFVRQSEVKRIITGIDMG